MIGNNAKRVLWRVSACSGGCRLFFFFLKYSKNIFGPIARGFHIEFPGLLTLLIHYLSHLKIFKRLYHDSDHLLIVTIN